MDVANGQYIDEQSDYEGQLKIKFDTNRWIVEDGDSTFSITDIKVDRFGYTWMGWYTRSKCVYTAINNNQAAWETDTSNIWKNFYQYIVVAGNSASTALDILNLDYTMFLSFFDNKDNVKEATDYLVGPDTTESGCTGITWNVAYNKKNPDGSDVVLNDNSFFVYGDFTENFSDDPARNVHIITLSAGWQGNTYEITYYYSDVHSVKNYDIYLPLDVHEQSAL